MYEFIKGKLINIKDDYIILENYGIGYKIFITASDQYKLIKDKEYLFHISFIVREDGVYLYGFLEESPKEVFELLTKVSGVGPKVAMGILSSSSVAELANAIEFEDLKFLQQIKGIGPKTAGRLILEMEGKLEQFAGTKNEIIEKPITGENEKIALDALENLGYHRYEVEQVFLDINLENLSMEDIIKTALKKLA